MKPTAPDRDFVMVAPNGARRTKDDHPALPMEISEIVEETQRCAHAGADALHLHVRDQDGAHTLDAGLYREALQAIDAALPGFPVQITTEAAGRFSPADQLACVEGLKPKAISVSIREMARDETVARRLYALSDELGTHVQHILYDLNDWAQLQSWLANGIVQNAQTDTISVLGRYADKTIAKPQDLNAWTPILANRAGRRMVCAFGPLEHQILCAAARLGADLRLGFENNLCAPSGAPAQNTAANVAALRAALLSQHDRSLAV